MASGMAVRPRVAGNEPDVPPQGNGSHPGAQFGTSGRAGAAFDLTPAVGGRKVEQMPSRSHPSHPASRSTLPRRLVLATVAVLLTWMVRVAVFGPHGYLALRREQALYAQQVQKLRQMQAENQHLHQDIHALRTSPAAIETIARRQLHLTRPGEVVYTY